MPDTRIWAAQQLAILDVVLEATARLNLAATVMLNHVRVLCFCLCCVCAYKYFYSGSDGNLPTSH